LALGMVPMNHPPSFSRSLTFCSILQERGHTQRGRDGQGVVVDDTHGAWGRACDVYESTRCSESNA
jgi:hypothetical protein